MKSHNAGLKVLGVTLFAVSLPLLSAWYWNNRPLDNFVLEASSEFELSEVTPILARVLTERELQLHVDENTGYPEIKKRWQVMRSQMLQQGATTKEADEVLEDARESLPTIRYRMPVPHWPIFVKRGVLKPQESSKLTSVWVIYLAWPKPAGAPRASDEPSWRSYTMIIDPQQPGTISGSF